MQLFQSLVWRRSCCRDVVEHTNVPALCEDYPHGEEEEDDGSAYPSVGDVGCGLVEVGLVDLFHSISMRLQCMLPTIAYVHTCWNLVVCAETAAKGVSGSGASIVAVSSTGEGDGDVW